MKKISFLIPVLFLSLSLGAQSFVEDHYEYLMDADESTVVKVNQSTFRYASAFVEESEADEEIDAKELLENINYLVLVAMEDMEDARSTYTKGMRDMESGYEELVNVKSKDGRFCIQVDETGGVVNEIVGIGTDGNNFVAGSVLCKVKLEDVGKIIKNIDVDNWKSFREVSDIDYETLNIYPNPVSTSGELSVQIPQQLIGGKLRIVDTQGASIKVFDADNSEKTISTQGLGTGNYLISITKDDITVNRKIMVVD